MSQRLEPGWLDRVFNSTITLPQQVMWRIWRAIEDDKVDLFSEKGLLDSALIPLFGIADSHEHDVMPDYMAEQVGFAEKGKSGFWSQFGASVIFDPLSWMSGGLTSLAKVGASTTKAAKLPAFAAKAKAAAQSKNVPYEGFVDSLSTGEFRQLLADTASTAATGGRAARKSQRTANKLLAQFDNSIQDAGRVATQKGLPANFTVKQAREAARDRQIALGLPILSLFGAQRNVFDGYSSWWQLFKQGVSVGGSSIAKAHVTQSLLSVPGVSTVLNTVKQPYRHGMFGYRYGQDAQIMLPPTQRSIKAGDAERYMNYMSTDGGRDIGVAIERAFAKNANVGQELRSAFFDRIKENKTYEEAFVGALKSVGILGKSNTESAASIWGRLSGLTKDNDVFPTWTDITSAATDIESAISKFRSNHLKASQMFGDGDVAIIAASTEARKMSQFYEAERAQFPSYLKLLSDRSFETGKAFRGLLNKMFKSGEKSDFAAKDFGNYMSHVARDGDQAEILGAELYRALGKVADEQSVFTLDELNRVVSSVMQLDALPGELAATFQAFRATPDPQKLVPALQAFLNRQHSGIITLEKILKANGVSNAPDRARLLKFFDDDVFPFVERTVGDKTTTFEISFGKNMPEVQFADTIVYTPAEKLRMQRAINAHVVKSKDVLPASLIGKQAGSLSDTVIADAVTRLGRKATRQVTRAEVLTALSGNKAAKAALDAFEKKHKVTVPEILGFFSKTNPVNARNVTRKVQVAQPIRLWTKTKTDWKPDEALAKLNEIGLTIVPSFGNKLAVDFTDWAVAFRQHAASTPYGKLDRSAMKLTEQAFDDYGTLMRTVYNYMTRTKKVMQPFRPTKEVTKTITVDSASIEKLRRTLVASKISDDMLRGTAQVDDITRLSPDELADYTRLTQLQKRRALPKENMLHEPGQIVGKKVKVPTGIRPPRAPDDVKSVVNTKGSITKLPVSAWAMEYASARGLINEIDRYIARAQKYNMPVSFDPRLLATIEQHMASSGALIREAVEQALPTKMGEIFKRTRAMRAAAWDSARRAGVWLPGSPIAYLPRFFNQAQKERVAKLIGDIDVEDSHILMRLGVKQAQHFKRSLDELTLEDLDNLQAELRYAINEKTASPKLAQLHTALDKELKDAGLNVSGVPRNLPYDKAKRLEHDPFISLIQRLGNAQQNDTLAGYFDSLLESSKGTNGESLMMTGKVIGVVDDTGKTHRTTRPVIEVTEEVSQAGDDVATLAQGAQEFSYTPKSLLIQDADGTVRVIENGLFNETGFALLPLGRDVSEQVGHKVSAGYAFARASLRAELHTKTINKVMSQTQADELIGQQVVFGSQNNLVAAVKVAAQAHKVDPVALRTFDSVNFMVKSFQTVFNIPFHIYNLAGGVHQALISGASPKNLAAGYIHTLRLLFGNQEFSRRSDQMLDMMGVNSQIFTHGFLNLPAGNRHGIQTAARALGSGKFAKYISDNAAELGLNTAEHFALRHVDGTETDILEFLQVAGEMQLYGTFASSLMRGSTTIADNLTSMKVAALAPESLITRLPKGLYKRFQQAAETTEVVNRTATALALIMDGYPMRKAIEITKEAHVPYEKLTPFERNVLKRVSAYYTFPRHYVPFALARFAENPSKLAHTIKFMRDQNVVTTQEGKPNLVVGQYRLDLGRLNPNIEAAGMIAAFADRILLPGMEFISSDVEYDRRFLRNAYSHTGITAAGGIASMVLDDWIPQGERGSPQSPDFFREAADLIWPIRAMRYMLGRTGGKEDASIFTEYTDLDKLITDSVLGIGLRKVRDEHELVLAQQNFRKLVRGLEMKAAAATTPELRNRYLDSIRELQAGYMQIMSESRQKVFK